MKLNKLIFVLIFLILISSVNAFFIGDVKCNEDGSINLIFSGETNDKIYTKELEVKASLLDFYDNPISKFDIEGIWDKNRVNGYELSYFKSEEALFNSPGKYLIEAKYKDKIVNYNLKDCVGLVFSCKLMGMEIKNCSTVDNKYFSALLEINGLNYLKMGEQKFLDQIMYELQAENKYEDYRNKFSTIGSLPKGFKLNKLNDDEYFFSYEFKDNNVKSIKAEFKELIECKKYNVKLSDKKECSIIQTEIKDKLQDNELQNKITGNIVQDIPKKDIFIKEKDSKWAYWLICGIIIMFIISIIIILKNKKVNKWV